MDSLQTYKTYKQLITEYTSKLRAFPYRGFDNPRQLKLFK